MRGVLRDHAYVYDVSENPLMSEVAPWLGGVAVAGAMMSGWLSRYTQSMRNMRYETGKVPEGCLTTLPLLVHDSKVIPLSSSELLRKARVLTKETLGSAYQEVSLGEEIRDNIYGCRQQERTRMG